LSNTSKVFALKERLPASVARRRIGLMPTPHPMGDVLPRIGTIPQERPSSLFQENNGASAGQAEHAMMEAAIQLDLITPRQAEALVEKGKTLEGWLVENKEGEAGPARKVGRRMLDRVAVFALLLLNFVVLAGIGWIVLRVLRSL
jgi:hypothetical protein